MDANKNVYRYISFENFVDVVINERLTLVSPLSFWEDTYEGWLFRMLQQKYPDSQSNQFPQNALQAIQLLGKTVVAQCWTKNCDSVAMWSIYSYSNKAVMIKTRRSKLASINRIMSLVDVEYNDTKQTAKDELSKMMQFNNSQAGLGLFAPFIRKRNEFSHENEVRVFAAKDGPINTNSKWETLEINIAPVSEFIEGVMVHPLATDWYVKQIQTNNDIVGAKLISKENCIKKVWEHIIFTLQVEISTYRTQFKALNDEVNTLTQLITDGGKASKTLESEIAELNKKIISTAPTIKSINDLLRDSGFQGFFLREKRGHQNVYEVVRQDGQVAEKLSEPINYLIFDFAFLLLRERSCFKISFSISKCRMYSSCVMLDVSAFRGRPPPFPVPRPSGKQLYFRN